MRLIVVGVVHNKQDEILICQMPADRGDMIGLKGKIRQWYGWLIIVLSDIAFASVTIFEMKRLFITEAEQQPLVNGLMYAIDFGLGMLLVILAVVMVWRFIDLFKNKGRWTEEVAHELAQEVSK